MSDIHLGHRRTKTTHILKGFSAELLSPDYIKTLNILFISGDIFDSLMDCSNPDILLIITAFHELFALCAKHGVKVRILRGTRRHDWDQPALLQCAAEIGSTGVDFKYMKEISIEYIEEYDRYVMYIPDEANPTHEQTLDVVMELLRSRGLTQVDILIMHGNFEHQLPEMAGRIPSHDYSAYESIVKEFISIGHIHRPSIHRKAIAPGSFDRTAHNEEENKGYVTVVCDGLGGFDASFRVNKNALEYKTIVCNGIPLEDAFTSLRKAASALKDGAWIRIRANQDDAILQSLPALAIEYPKLHWSTKVDRIEVDDATDAIDSVISFTPVTITRDNMVSLLTERLQAGNYSSDLISDVCSVLTEHL